MSNIFFVSKTIRAQVVFRPWLSLCSIPYQASSIPDERVVALIPVDEALSTCDPRDRCPTATETNIVLLIEEIGGITRVECHWLETLIRRQRATSPLPKASGIALTTQATSITCHRRRVPKLEPDVSTLKIQEQIPWVQG